MADRRLPRQMDCPVASRPLRIGFVYSRIPFPMMRGDQMTVAHLISFLAARGHVLDLYTMALDGNLEPEQKDWLEQSCRNVRLYEPSKLSRMWGLLLGL